MDAKNALLARYRELLAATGGKEKLDDATRIQDEMKYFEKDGLLIPRGDMTKSFLKYGETLKKVSDDLASAYSAVVAEYIKAGELDRADELRRELVAYSLPTKLVSIQVFRSKAYIGHADYLAWGESVHERWR